MKKKVIGQFCVLLVSLFCIGSAFAVDLSDCTGYMTWDEIVTHSSEWLDSEIIDENCYEYINSSNRPYALIVSVKYKNSIPRYIYHFLNDEPYLPSGETTVYGTEFFQLQCATYNPNYWDKYNEYYMAADIGSIVSDPSNLTGISSILFSTIDIKDEAGNVIFSANLDDGAVKNPSYDFEHDWLSQTTEEGIYIIAPKSGKAFTLKDPAVNITVQYRYGDPLGKTGYQHLYASTDGTTFSKIANNDTSLSPFSGVMLSQDEKIVEHDGKPYKEGTLTYKLNVRKNIQLTLYAAMEKTDIVGLDLKPETFQSNSINLTWYDDFIDEDGDGNDDRDNDPDYHPSQDDQANNTDVSKFESITDVLNSLKGTLSGFISFITNFFKFIPSDIFILIGVGITIIILLRIFGR